MLGARAGEREREYSWGAVRSLLEPILIASDPDELEELWSGPAAAARSLLEGTTAPEGADATTYAIFNGLYWLIRRLADRQPLFLAIDDLHWVDGSSLGFLEFLSRRIGEMPVVLAGTLRPNEPGTDLAVIAALASDPQTLSSARNRSPPRARRARSKARLGESATDGVLREGHDVTGGNPLLLSELARTIDVEGTGDEGAAVAGNIAALGARAVSRTVEVRLAAPATTHAGWPRPRRCSARRRS